MTHLDARLLLAAACSVAAALLAAPARAAGVPAGSCTVRETRSLEPSCSLRAEAVIADGRSRRFVAQQPGWQAEQTAACSRGRLVWLPGSCRPAGAAHADDTAAADASRLPLTLAQLRQFNTDMNLAHEAAPAGVPSSYDWHGYPKVDQWNQPPQAYAALTGWGQAFWTQGTARAEAYLQLRRHQTLVCHGQPRRWTRVQARGVEGAEFRPDFQGNAAVPTPFFTALGPHDHLVGWSPAGAYHFWPSGGRAAMPAGPICGVLVLVQARAVSASPGQGETPGMLLGLGADYWINKSAPWDNYKTNAGVGVGRLKLVDADWRWYGFSSASDADLQRLDAGGYVDGVGR